MCCPHDNIWPGAVVSSSLLERVLTSYRLPAFSHLTNPKQQQTIHMHHLVPRHKHHASPFLPLFQSKTTNRLSLSPPYLSQFHTTYGYHLQSVLKEWISTRFPKPRISRRDRHVAILPGSMIMILTSKCVSRILVALF